MEHHSGTVTRKSHADLVIEMDARRRARVSSYDRERRLKEVCGAVFMSLPFAWLYANASETGPMGWFEGLMIMANAAGMFGVPAFLIKSMLPEGESWRSRRRMPTFVPPPPMLEGGEYGEPWSPNQEDVIFDRIRLVMDAVDGRDADALRTHLENFTRRARELCHPDPIYTPSEKSSYHYWPNRKTEPGPHEGDTIVTYEDNHPIQHQRKRLKETISDLKHALGAIATGVDRTDTSIAVRDVVTVLRRVIEIEGFDASALRPSKTRVIEPAPMSVSSDLAAYKGPGADIINLVKKAVRIDPDLTDGLGNPIAPLLTRHVPRLLETYRQALQTAHQDEHAAIQRDLLEALELVRRATEEGLARYSDERRQALRTEIAFLRMRGMEDTASLIPKT